MKKSFMMYLEAMRNNRIDPYYYIVIEYNGNNAGELKQFPHGDVVEVVEDYLTDLIKNYNGEIYGGGSGFGVRDISLAIGGKQNAINFLKIVSKNLKPILKDFIIDLHDRSLDSDRTKKLGSINTYDGDDTFLDFMAGREVDWGGGFRY